MASICSPYNVDHRVHQQNFPAQEKKNMATPIPKRNLSWWKKLLNFFKGLWNRIFNKSQETTPNDGNNGNNGQLVLNTVLKPNRHGEDTPSLQQDPSSIQNSTDTTKLSSYNELNDTMIHDILQLSEARDSGGLLYRIFQLKKLLCKQMAPLLRTAENDPHVALPQDMQEQLNYLKNGQSVLCSVSRANTFPELDVTPISLEKTLFAIIRKSHNNQLQDMAKDMFKTLQITKQAFHMYHIYVTHDQEFATTTPLPDSYQDDKKRLQTLVKANNISKHAKEVISITVEGFILYLRQQTQCNIKAKCAEIFPKARNLFKEQLLYPSTHVDFLTTYYFKILQTTLDLEHCSRSIFSVEYTFKIYEYFRKPFVQLLTLNIESPIDQINKEDIIRALDDIACMTRLYKVKENDHKVNIPREYTDLATAALFTFMPQMLKEPTGISKPPEWLYSPNIAARVKWWIPQELMERFEQKCFLKTLTNTAS